MSTRDLSRAKKTLSVELTRLSNLGLSRFLFNFYYCDTGEETGIT